MLVLNTIFLFGVSIAVSRVAMRAYLASGSSSILLLGCGVLALGGAALAGGWVRPLGGTANTSVTVHNLGVLLGAIFHAMSALLTLLKGDPERIIERRWRKLLFGFAGTLALITIIIIATILGMVPLFWVAGVGSTPLKQGVLGAAVILFALTSIYTMVLYFQKRPYFLYWYSLALALTTIGLIGIAVMKAVGDPIGWVGRTAQYLGGIYFLIAAVSALREAQAQSLPLDEAIDHFYRRSEVHYRDLVDTMNDAIISLDDRRRVLLWNPGAERMLGYTSDEAAACHVRDLLMPEGHQEDLDNELQSLQKDIINHPFAAKELEIVLRRKDGTIFPSETSLSVRRIGSGWTATLVVRDITERKRAEEELKQRTLELQHLTETLEERVKERTAELSDLSSQLVSAQEKERKRVSYDLHDNVWQTLEIIKSQIEHLFSGQDEADRAVFQQKSRQIIPLIRNTVARIRSMQGDLWPSVLDDIGILATLEWYCREFRASHPALSIERHVDLAEDDVPAPVKIVIYRVMQEALTNVTQHSQAKHVSLSLTKDSHRLEFTVRDDGIGFNPGETIAKRSPWGGMGLLSMRQRTELSGGLFGVESAKGQGTTVRASWPLRGNG